MVSQMKEDRRTRYTKNIIKDTLLELMHQKPFDKITVTELCRKAEINRGTFYLHYVDIYAVLDELEEDALNLPCDNNQNMDGHSADMECESGKIYCDLTTDHYQCPYGICDKIHSNPQYGVIFFDDSLTGHIVEKIASVAKEKYVKDLIKQCELTPRQAETIFYFQLNGCLAINKNIYKNGAENWQETRDLVGGFILGGLRRYMKTEQKDKNNF